MMRASLYFSTRVAPDVKIAPLAAGLGAAGFLKPLVLVGGVVDHQLGDDAQAALVGLAQKLLEVGQVAVNRIDAAIIRNVITLVAQRRRIKRQQPDRGNAEVLQIIQLRGQPAKIADAVGVAVAERAHVRLVDDGFFIPQRVFVRRGCWMILVSHVYPFS